MSHEKIEKRRSHFTKDVAPIFFKNCAQCYRPDDIAPFSVLSYKDARPWAKSIKEQVVKREMPPWYADPHHGQFQNEMRLTQAEIDTIAAWVDGGAKEGNPKDLPTLPKASETWEIGQPDVVLTMPQEFELPAKGATASKIPSATAQSIAPSLTRPSSTTLVQQIAPVVVAVRPC